MPPIDDPLVSTDWLSARIDDLKVKIIDASFKMPGVLPLPLDDYLGAHIPGAVFFDVDAIADHNDARPHMYPDAEQLLLAADEARIKLGPEFSDFWGDFARMGGASFAQPFL